MFIVVEGIDGSGTTTHARLLADALRERGVEVEATFEPSDGPVGRLVREALAHPQAGATFGWAAMALLFAADRMDHAERTIVPALQSGRWVISDRFDLSSIVYQSLTATVDEPVIPWIRQLNGRVPRPDLTIVLDVAADVAEARRLQRGSAREMYDDSGLQERLARAYASAEQLVPGDRVVHVGAEEHLPVVARNVLDAVRTAGLLPEQGAPGANLPPGSGPSHSPGS